MTSLTGVFIFFLLKAEPEVDLSFQGVSGCRREEQGQWGQGRRKSPWGCCHGRGPHWADSEEPVAMALRMFPLNGSLCLGGQDPRGTRLVFSACYISCSEV